MPGGSLYRIVTRLAYGNNLKRRFPAQALIVICPNFERDDGGQNHSK
jgi:hypothetical protein